MASQKHTSVSTSAWVEGVGQCWVSFRHLAIIGGSLHRAKSLIMERSDPSERLRRLG